MIVVGNDSVTFYTQLKNGKKKKVLTLAASPLEEVKMFKDEIKKFKVTKKKEKKAA